MSKVYLERIFEYPIRCYDCGELMDCRVLEMVSLIKQNGYGMAEALNDMGITNECTRGRFTTPACIDLMFKNNNLIEGKEEYTPIMNPSRNTTVGSQSVLTLKEQQNINNNNKTVIKNSELPPIVGIPVIDQKDNVREETRYIGGGLYSRVLGGRKYLCR